MPLILTPFKRRTTLGNLRWVLNNPNAFGTNPNAFGTSGSDWFGSAVAITESNSYIVAGAFYEDDTGAEASGKAYVFDL